MDDFSVPPKIGNKNWSVMGVEGGFRMQYNYLLGLTGKTCLSWGCLQARLSVLGVLASKTVCPGGACKQDCLS